MPTDKIRDRVEKLIRLALENSHHAEAAAAALKALRLMREHGLRVEMIREHGLLVSAAPDTVTPQAPTSSSPLRYEDLAEIMRNVRQQAPPRAAEWWERPYYYAYQAPPQAAHEATRAQQAAAEQASCPHPVALETYDGWADEYVCGRCGRRIIAVDRWREMQDAGRRRG